MNMSPTEFATRKAKLEREREEARLTKDFDRMQSVLGELTRLYRGQYGAPASSPFSAVPRRLPHNR
jgi:hypothetical protein